MADARSLYQAIEALKLYYPVSGRDDFLREQVTSSKYTSTVNDEIFRVVLNFLDGGRRISDILKDLERFAADVPELTLEKLLSVYYDADSPIVAGTISDITGDTALSENPSAPTKDDGHVAIIQIFPADVTPANRFTDASALFLTAVPSVEMARCVPFLSINLILPRAPLDNVRPLSLHSFLSMGEQPTGLDKNLVEAAGIMREGLVRSAEDGSVSPEIFVHTVTGMEIFTSPQTLTNLTPGALDAGRAVPVLDPFRPLLSLKSLEFNVVPTTGMMSYKSAKLQLTLHDRSRLSEIADLVRPDLYSTVELLIEYGWSHPDGSSSSENIYGKLIENMRVREKYGVVNSSFVFTESGQADITVELYMKGVVDFSTVKVAQSKRVVELTQQIVLLTEAISTVRSQLVNARGTKEVRGALLLDSTSDITSALTLSRSALKELRTFLHNKDNATSPDTSGLYDALLSLYGKDGTSGAVKDLDAELNQVLDQKLSSLSSTPDPILQSLPSEIANFSNGTNFQTNAYVSLGKLLLRFIGEPLLAADKFNEVHLIFYSFNAGAGAVRNANIGSFPIKVSDFKESWRRFTKNRGKFNVTLKEFIDYISNNFIADIANPVYGMSEVYKSSGFDDTGDREPVDPRIDSITELNSTIEARMRRIGIADGVFRMPEVDLYAEAVPQGVGLEGDLTDPEVTILRLHIFDKQTSPYLGLQQLLDAMLDKNLGTFGEPNSSDEDKSKHQALASRVVEAALAEGFIEEVRDDNSETKRTFILGPTATPTNIKRFVSKLVPTLRYGTSTSGIKQISMRSLQDPLLSTVHMQRSGLGDPLNAPGVDGEIVPLQMLPTELDCDIFGCPLINFGQQFFVDLDTGTTVDNIYGVVKLNHKIEPGRFDTSMTLINIDAYGKYRSALNAIGEAINILGANLRQSRN